MSRYTPFDDIHLNEGGGEGNNPITSARYHRVYTVTSVNIW